MQRLSAIAAAIAAFAGVQLSGQPQAEAQSGFPPIVIVGYETFGKGCPPMSIPEPISQGSADGGRPGQSETLGRQWIGLELPDFFAKVDTGRDSDSRQCQITLHLEATTPGNRILVNRVKFDGVTALQDGVVAQLDAAYSWSGKTLQAVSQTPHRYIGPRSLPFAIDDVVQGSQPSACASREKFEIKASINVTNTNPRRNGSFTVSEAQVEIGSRIDPLDRPPGTGAAVWIQAVLEPCARRL
jgi:Domain of unknown function (DUF4360)